MEGAGPGHVSRKNRAEVSEGENAVLLGLNRVSRYGTVSLGEQADESLRKL